MKHVKKDCWLNDKESTLLEKHGPNMFYIPQSFMTAERLGELRIAIADALRKEQVLARVNGAIIPPGDFASTIKEEAAFENQ